MDFDLLDERGIIYFPANGKIPAIKGWQDLTVSKRAKEGKKCNYAILCGQVSGITVIDIDNKGDSIILNGMKFWDKLLKQFNNNEDLVTPMVKTPSGGRHLYFKYNPNLKTGSHNVKGFDSDGFKVTVAIDIRNDKGLCIAAGSVNSELKKRYRYHSDLNLEDVDPMEMPEWLVDALTKDVIVDGDNISFVPRVKKAPINTMDINEATDATPEKFDKDLFRQIIQSLGKDRAHIRDDWLKVCFCVGSVDRKFGWNNLDVLIEFSKLSPKFSSEDEVEARYNEADGSYGLGSAWYWIKEDAPAKFNELYRKSKTLFGEKTYYEDYEKVMTKHEEQGFINSSEVVDYLKGAFVKINDGGNTKWLSRNKDDSGNDKWNLLKGNPFSDNRIEIMIPVPKKEETDEVKYKKSSFYSVLQKCSVANFPIFNRMDFIPYLYEEQKNYSDRIFNLFSGFPHKPDGAYDATIIQPILTHMKDILCTRNQALFDYYIRYLAHAIQYPADKPGTAIIFMSPQGVGKDMINYDFLKLVFGKDLLHRVNDLSDITRNFNKKLEGKLITIVGEVRKFNDDTDTEKLKGMLTDNTINIEPKGRDVYEVRDVQRFIMHTNNYVPMGIKPDDRRFILQSISAEHIQTKEYYNALGKDANNPEIAAHFFKYLAQMDLTEFNVRDRPYTAAKKNIQILTASNSIRFMADVYSRRWELSDAKITDGEIKIHSTKLYDNYKNWATENNEKKLTAKSFKQKLLECGFVEHNIQFKLNYSKANGYKTSYDEIYNCFSDYIDKKNDDNTNHPSEDESDED